MICKHYYSFRRKENYLRIEEGSKYSNCSTKGIDRLDGCAEDDDRGYNDRYPLHGVANAKCQGRDLIQGHVRHLIV